MKISDIQVFEVQGEWSGPEFPPGDRQAQMLDIYPEFNTRDASRERRGSARQMSAAYVEIQTDEGVSGLFGPIDDAQIFVIRRYLRPFLLGRDPLATEALHDQMLRIHRHGRSGLFMTGLSAIDCALWDLKGKAWDVPIHRLLGGPTRPAIPAYASMLGYAIEPTEAATVAVQYQSQGFGAQKWFFRYGPADGETGKDLNVGLVRALREALGPHYPLMFDAFMGWDVPYATAMARLLEPFHITWLEEPIPPERVGGLRELRHAARVPIATGEHVYTRWQVKELLVTQAVDVIQTDPDWTGGITELVKICSLASAFDTPVVAHGHSLLAALHVAGAQSPTAVPMVEYLIRHQEAKQFFHRPIYRPAEGALRLPELPGLGLMLDETRIVDRRTLL
jgi:L-alanine-DL-glutamate epimerase-like enolase superfamily enzyme